MVFVEYGSSGVSFFRFHCWLSSWVFWERCGDRGRFWLFFDFLLRCEGIVYYLSCEFRCHWARSILTQVLYWTSVATAKRNFDQGGVCPTTSEVVHGGGSLVATASVADGPKVAGSRRGSVMAKFFYQQSRQGGTDLCQG